MKIWRKPQGRDLSVCRPCDPSTPEASPGFVPVCRSFSEGRKARTHNHQMQLFLKGVQYSALIDRSRGMGPCFRRDESYQRRQAVPSPRHFAFDIAGHAGPADFGPHRIDCAGGLDPDLA
jgi:hypothetical protein